jgi:hypothetical protein
MTTHLGIKTATATVLVAVAVFFPPPALAGDVSAATLGVPDSTPPTGAVGGVRSPAAGILDLRLDATDAGTGLAAAAASLDGGPASNVRLGTGSCPEHPAPGSEPPPGAECPESVSGVPLPIDTRSVPDGPHVLRVVVTDAAGNTAMLVERTITVRNAPPAGSGTSATVTVGVASKSPSGGGGGRSGGGSSSSLPPSPPPQGTSQCRSPQLKMRLAVKPLWRTRPGKLPVLRFGVRHPYRGQLTCRVGGRRVAAAVGTPVHVVYRIWRNTTFKRHKGPVRRVRKTPIETQRGGRLAVRLGFPTGRTIIFSYRSSNGELARVKLRIAVARPDPPAKGER